MKSPSAFLVLRAPVLEDSAQVDAFHAAVERLAFHDVLPSKTSSCGWTAPGEPSKPPSRYDCITGDAGIIAIGIRYDEKKVPDALVRIRVDAGAVAWTIENGKDKCPRAIRHEIEDRIRLELLDKTPATPSTAVLLYDTSNGTVFVDGASGAAVKAVAGLWRDTFAAMDLRTYGILDRVRDRLTPEQIEHVSVSDPADPHLGLRGERMGQFLGWLWFKGETSTSSLPSIETDTGKLEWMAAREIHLMDKSSQKRRLSVRATDAATDPAVRASLVDGHAIESLGLTLNHNGQWIADVTLTAKEGELSMGACKLPPLAEGDIATQAIEMAWLLESVHSYVARLFLHWATTAGSADALDQGQASMRRWLEQDLKTWLHESTAVPVLRAVN